MRNKGFSLIELLTVIGIVGILAGIGLPALSRAKGSARLTRCIAQQKSVATALTASVQDFYPIGLPYSKEKYMTGIPMFPEVWGQIEREYVYTHLRPDHAFGAYDVYRSELLNCPDTQERKTTTPFNLAWGWARGRKENAAWNYEINPEVLVFNNHPSSIVVSDSTWLRNQEEFELYMPYNSNFERFKVVFRGGMLHRTKEEGAVQTFRDLSTHWMPREKILQERGVE